MNIQIWKKLDRQRSQRVKVGKSDMQDMQQIANICITVSGVLLQKAYFEYRDHDDIFHNTFLCLWLHWSLFAVKCSEISVLRNTIDHCPL